MTQYHKLLGGGLVNIYRDDDSWGLFKTTVTLGLLHKTPHSLEPFQHLESRLNTE